MKKLHDPDLPAGEIVEVRRVSEDRKDDIWVRNDGVKLTSAEKNPFYVLATVCGDYADGYDKEIAAKNRRIWIGWACAEMAPEARAKLAEDMGLEAGALDPLTADETVRVKAAFRNRLGEGVEIPGPDRINLSKTYFSQTSAWASYVFASSVDFSSVHFAGFAQFSLARFADTASFDAAHFVGDANFSSGRFEQFASFGFAYFADLADFTASQFVDRANFASGQFVNFAHFISAYFAGIAQFTATQFADWAQFTSAHFAAWADFRSSHFSNLAKFTSARFARRADFTSVHFAGRADFASAHFASAADFTNGDFKGSTHFQEAQFQGRVPRFQQRAFYDDTNFTQDVADRAGERFWPKVPENRHDALSDKNAYRRLRQVSAEQHNTEAEHFFLRQEMACATELQQNRFSRWIIKAFGFFSDYGYSVGWPAFWLFIVWIVGSSMIEGVFGWYIVNDWPLGESVGVPGEFDAYGLGFSNTFAIFGFRSFYLGEDYMTALPTFVKLVGGVQTILGFVFLFFLGLGLRNRFRLK